MFAAMALVLNSVLQSSQSSALLSWIFSVDWVAIAAIDRSFDCQLAQLRVSAFEVQFDGLLATGLITIGSYGTRNVIEVMESWFWERPTDCLVLKLMMSLIICLSSIFRGNPLFLGAFAWPCLFRP
jgi:hypothetical protein